MSSDNPDWKKELELASERARKKADQATGSQLDTINKQVDTLERVFEQLKLTDATTYNALVSIVEEATSKNESISDVISRLEALRDAASKLADLVQSLTPSGSLRTLAKALKD